MQTQVISVVPHFKRRRFPFHCIMNRWTFCRMYRQGSRPWRVRLTSCLGGCHGQNEHRILHETHPRYQDATVAQHLCYFRVSNQYCFFFFFKRIVAAKLACFVVFELHATPHLLLMTYSQSELFWRASRHSQSERDMRQSFKWPLGKKKKKKGRPYCQFSVQVL